MKFESSIVINRPVENVWAYMADFKNMPVWSPDTVETRITSEGPVQKGTTYVWIGQSMGRRIEVNAKVTEFEVNRGWGYQSVSGPFVSSARFALESANGGTRVTVSEEADVSGFFKLAEPVIARMGKRQMDTGLANLKDVLEAQH